MKKFAPLGRWIIFASLAFWGLALITLVSPSIIDNSSIIYVMPLLLFGAMVFTLIAAIILVKGSSLADPTDDRYVSSIFAKIIAALILVALVVSTYTAIKSFWYNPLSNDFGDKFTYQNIATGVGFASIVLTFILSAIQKDVYWVTRNKTKDLDERQLYERQQVFEKSYKLGAILVTFAAWTFAVFSHSISAIIANNYGSIPGHMYWLGFNVAITLFALPLILAAWKRR